VYTYDRTEPVLVIGNAPPVSFDPLQITANASRPMTLGDHAGAWAQKFHDRAFESAVHFVMLPWYLTFGAIDAATDPLGTVERRVETIKTTYQQGSDLCGGGLTGASCGASFVLPGGSLRRAGLETGYELYQGDWEKLRDRSAVVAADVSFALFTGAAGRSGAASGLGRGNLGSSLSRGMARPRPGGGVRAAVRRELRDAPDLPRIPCVNSFPAGTEVQVPGPSGPVTLPIEELRVGDAVLARQEHGDEVGEQRVSGTYSHRVPTLLRLTLASLPEAPRAGSMAPAAGDREPSATAGSVQPLHSLSTTPSHELWSERGWVAAAALEVGDRVFSQKHGWLELAASETLDQWTEVYTLEVTGEPTFFAGEAAILVHNGKPPCNNFDLRTQWHDRYGSWVVGGRLDPSNFRPFGKLRKLDHVQPGPRGRVGFEFSLTRWHRLGIGTKAFDHKLAQLRGDLEILRTGGLAEIVWVGPHALGGSPAGDWFHSMMRSSGLPIRYEQRLWSQLPPGYRRW
jgi:hypothetical protein